MTRKFSEARRAAFLRALAETGNQGIAAERAKVSRSWVQLHRATDPDFRQACLDAVAAAKVRLAKAAGRTPGWATGAGWATQGGEELIVRGTRSGTGRRVQIGRARLKQWTPRVEARFLGRLAACCNVKAACAAVGLTPASAYAHRQRWPRFAKAWDAAVREGHMRVEAALVAAACAALDPEEVPVEETIGPMNVDQAIHLLHMHKNRVHNIGKAPGRWRRPRTLDEVRESILKKLEAVASYHALEGEEEG